jgi:hypothetical protein
MVACVGTGLSKEMVTAMQISIKNMEASLELGEASK